MSEFWKCPDCGFENIEGPLASIYKKNIASGISAFGTERCEACKKSFSINEIYGKSEQNQDNLAFSYLKSTETAPSLESTGNTDFNFDDKVSGMENYDFLGLQKTRKAFLTTLNNRIGYRKLLEKSRNHARYSKIPTSDKVPLDLSPLPESIRKYFNLSVEQFRICRVLSSAANEITEESREIQQINSESVSFLMTVVIPVLGYVIAPAILGFVFSKFFILALIVSFIALHLILKNYSRKNLQARNRMQTQLRTLIMDRFRERGMDINVSKVNDAATRGVFMLALTHNRLQLFQTLRLAGCLEIIAFSNYLLGSNDFHTKMGQFNITPESLQKILNIK
ncbi:hypothetical protein KKF34_02465 [Myxococcota bacterium]|nr:hypothetical protein [Myxococcota bacterium]MBU1379509.1 hypothetical protein [Myxococcota bacterium]MBU1495726.1 hypothetical protein [Myxococcota bacterium]